MKKIRLDPFTIVLIVIVLLVVFSLFGKYFNSVKARVSELEDQVRNDLRLLKLSEERKEELAKKAAKSYRIVVTLLFSTFLSLVSLTVFSGYSYLDALELNVGTVGVILTMITVIFYNTWNPDVLLKALREKIKALVYQKNNFDPSTIELLKSKISINQLELEELRMEYLAESKVGVA